MFNKEKFKEVVERSGLKGTYIAEGLGISYNLYLQKSNGLTKWKTDEAYDFANLLKLKKSDMYAIFFSKEVNKMRTDEVTL